MQQIVGKDGQIVGGGEQSGMAGNAAHASRGRVMDHAAQHGLGRGFRMGLRMGQSVIGIPLRRCNPGSPRGRRQVARMLHA